MEKFYLKDNIQGMVYENLNHLHACVIAQSLMAKPKISFNIFSQETGSDVTCRFFQTKDKTWTYDPLKQ